MAAKKNAGVLALFDVDGTLTAPRKEVTLEMLEFMKRLREVRPNVTLRPLISVSLSVGLSGEIAHCMSGCGSLVFFWEQNVTVGVVGGSDLVKISEQLGKSGTRLAWIQQYSLLGFRVPRDSIVCSSCL